MTRPARSLPAQALAWLFAVIALGSIAALLKQSADQSRSIASLIEMKRVELRQLGELGEANRRSMLRIEAHHAENRALVRDLAAGFGVAVPEPEPAP